jgi:hypothetical protein
MEAALATLSLEQLQTRLSEALDAVHALRTGKQIASTSFGDRSIGYQSLTQAEAYVAQLNAAIIAKTSGRKARSPLFARF